MSIPRVPRKYQLGDSVTVAVDSVNMRGKIVGYEWGESRKPKSEEVWFYLLEFAPGQLKWFRETVLKGE